MKKSHIIPALTLAVLVIGAHANNEWIGGGASGITTATIKGLRVQQSGAAYFTINQSNATIPAGRIWKFDSTTPAGASMLSNLLAAKSAGSPIQFMETNVLNSSIPTEWGFDNFTFGNSL